MIRKFEILLAWMKRWDVLTPEMQKTFLERAEVAALSAIEHEIYVYQAIDKHRKLSDVLTEALAQQKAKPVSRIVEDQDRRMSRGMLVLGGAFLLFLTVGWVALPIALFVFPILGRSGLFRDRKVLDLEKKYGRRFEISPIRTSLHESLRRGRSVFDTPLTTDVDPSIRYHVLADYNRSCAICTASPPEVHLTVTHGRKGHFSNLHDYRVICTGCLAIVG